MLEPIAAATRRDTRRLKEREKIGGRVGKIIGEYKMTKHITWSIDDDGILTIARNTVAPRLPGAEPFQVTTRPTPLQKKVLDHLGVRLVRSQ